MPSPKFQYHFTIDPNDVELSLKGTGVGKQVTWFGATLNFALSDVQNLSLFFAPPVAPENPQNTFGSPLKIESTRLN